MSGLGLVEQVQKLMRLPQELCNMCGKCCKIAVFKGCLTYEEVLALSRSTEEDETQVRGARDFLSIFVPFDSEEEVRKLDSEFIDYVYQNTRKAPDKDQKIGFFHCKFVSENNNCLIHEDRPLLCRMYPIPHERTFFIPGCGFKEQGKKNWQEIKKIMDYLEQKRKYLMEITAESEKNES